MEWIDKYTFLIYEQLDNTNSECLRLWKAGVGGNFIILAKHQTNGRGRQGRIWVSKPGNLYFSILQQGELTSEQAAQMSFVMTVSIGEMLAQILPKTVLISYRWPNDILLNGKKISGILLESGSKANSTTLDYLIVGVGVNLSQFPDDLPFAATSIFQESRVSLSNKDILPLILNSFEKYNAIFREKGFQEIRSLWLQKAHFLGRKVRVNSGNEIQEGYLTDLDAMGNLVLENDANQIARISIGEIVTFHSSS